MLKPLLFILTIVTLIALALNFDLFSDSQAIKAPMTKPIEKLEVKPHSEKQIIVADVPKNIVNESNLTKELQALLHKAQKLFREHKDSEALVLYEKVIKKSKNANEIKILKLFAQACFEKAAVHYIYPSYDIDSAIESYELVINNFKNRYNKKLLLFYMQAKLEKGKFSSKDDLLVAYDEIIEKFQKDKEKRFEKEIEELLFAQSFALMGVDDEKAIEILDKIIAKYPDKSNLPDTVKFSILNNIELSIITSNDGEKYVDLANQYMADSPDTKPLLDMLSIIKNAQDLDQSEALEKWNEEHNDYLFPDWDFSELRKWTNKMETPESQKRIREYLDIFERQKYKNLYNTPKSTVPLSHKATQNTTAEDSIEEDKMSEQEEVVPDIYEEDPYVNEIIDTQPELSYPDPYSQYDSNEQADGVSHTYQDDY